MKGTWSWNSALAARSTDEVEKSLARAETSARLDGEALSMIKKDAPSVRSFRWKSNCFPVRSIDDANLFIGH
jgi:hypothetical protein